MNTVLRGRHNVVKEAAIGLVYYVERACFCRDLSISDVAYIQRHVKFRGRASAAISKIKTFGHSNGLGKQRSGAHGNIGDKRIRQAERRPTRC